MFLKYVQGFFPNPILLTGFVMKGVGKMEKMDQDDFYNDDWNINEMEEKEELPEELRGLLDSIKVNA